MRYRICCRILIVAGFTGVLAACGGTGQKQRGFESAKTLPPLVVPADLVTASGSGSMKVPEPASPRPAQSTVPSMPAAAAPEARPGVTMQKTGDGVPTLMVAQPVDQVWPQIGQSLVDLGIEIERQDPQAGVYYIRYKDPDANEESGFVKRLFNRNKRKRYQLKLAASGTDSIATIYDKRGRPDKSATSQRLLAKLGERFK
jgi:uncharacterized lipoprotein